MTSNEAVARAAPERKRHRCDTNSTVFLRSLPAFAEAWWARLGVGVDALLGSGIDISNDSVCGGGP